MKYAMLLLFTVFALSACATFDRDAGGEREPADYNEAMDWIAAELRAIDRNVIGGAYQSAVPQTERVLLYVRAMGRLEPPASNDYEKFREFDHQVDDLRRATDRLLYMLEQRRRDGARDQLAAVARRYNRLAADYGPEIEVGVLQRPPERLDPDRLYRDDLPAEFMPR